MKIGNRKFHTKGHTYVMGILNITPDSFSDGGRYDSLSKALFRAEEMIQQGADVLDIGGESTRPGYRPVSAEEEISRVVPVIRGIKEHFSVPVSLDTWKSSVARAGIEAGADMINDIWGLKADPLMASVIAEHRIPCCVTHNRKTPDYTDLMKDILYDLEESISLARKAGISREQIILDPGIGFGKSSEESLEVLARLEELSKLQFPLLLGASRKSVIGEMLNLPVEERLEGTLATTVLAARAGYMFVRVHDIKENLRVIRMTESIFKGWKDREP